ncbi:hypothetical protein [Streptomyces daghestanicus]|uniref:Uncharacterized protein n=2 Tax=Streptomyces daghestanicus TaxID=66885 RepID=A0ABQ3QB98_9ACTN|nr:hypothetical protein [Streptomyces daghestanicus]GGU44588.1 hypothetical protein GCM10010259_39500 [Streptomyces daghestanicus]GHI34540.1 hypothetical protein Sdagh_62700 [Streptomyces daghestanicus]
MSELVVNGVTVVFEGVSRLVWQRAAPDRWTLVGVWPSRERRRTLRAAMDSGEQALVVLSGDRAASTLFSEELPESFAQGLPEECLTVRPDLQAGMIDIEVPPLDWLPEEHRTRGLRFADWARHQVATLPALVLPHLLVEDGPRRGPRFAFPTRPVTRAHVGLLEPLVRRVFPEDRPSP